MRDEDNFLNPLLQVGSGSGSGCEKINESGSGGPEINGSDRIWILILILICIKSKGKEREICGDQDAASLFSRGRCLNPPVSVGSLCNPPPPPPLPLPNKVTVVKLEACQSGFTALSKYQNNFIPILLYVHIVLPNFLYVLS